MTARVREWLRWREALLTVPPIMGKKMAGQHHAPIKAGKEHASVASDTTTPWRAALASRTALASASASCASQLAGPSLSDTAALVSRSTTWSGAGATALSATDCGPPALSPPWPAARAGGCQQSCIDQPSLSNSRPGTKTNENKKTHDSSDLVLLNEASGPPTTKRGGPTHHTGRRHERRAGCQT